MEKNSGLCGPLHVSKKNPRYFSDNSGKAIYLTGSHTWTVLVDSSAKSTMDFPKYIDFLKKYNHNFFRMWVTERGSIESENGWIYETPNPYLRTGPGVALGGRPKYDLARFDESYFKRLRQRLEEAQERNIYVAVMLFRGKSWEPVRAWKGHPFHGDNNINGINGDPDNKGTGEVCHKLIDPEITRLQEEYVRKIVDTVNDLDNVLYEICNEDTAYPGNTEWQYHMIDFIHQYEALKPKQHPVTMSWQIYAEDGNQIDPVLNDNLFKSPAEGIHIGGSDRKYQTNPPAASGDKVIVADVDHVWPENYKTWPWMCFLRGLHPIHMDWYGTVMTQGYPLTVEDQENIRVRMGQTLGFSQKVDLNRMVPREDLAGSGYCLADEGHEYLVYLPEGGSVSVDLSIANIDFVPEWFDPSTSESIASSPVRGGAKREFVAPFFGDAILHLRAL